mgnify:CR=1 FL=1|tara:strand:+ start:356 stop:778 length:423 start_codon:yes stop_codon:yes gene_type:complete
MAKKMNWRECVDQNIITKTNPDIERSNQMIAMADLRFEFWSKKIEEKFIVLKVEAYYDIIKELIFAYLYKNGFNCTNHLCLIAYLREHTNDFDYEIEKIDELRQVRNEINYRGFAVKKDFLSRNELEFKSIIKKLKEKLE